MPDIEAVITFLKIEDGGRQYPGFSGYHPNHLVTDNYLTSGIHHYYDKEEVLPGETVVGTITFITPDAYPHCLWEGKVINIQEGSKVVGYAKVTKIFNEVLKAK